MGRPTGAAWRPLDLDDDPTPGDPGRVSEEVSHLNSVAKTLEEQIAALKKIAGGDGDQLLVGEYADKIKESAGELVETLEKVHDRYTTVASALGGWEPDLVTAQAMSLRALNEAEGPYAQLQTLNGPTISAPQTSLPTTLTPALAPALTPAQQQAADAHKAAVTKAQGLLNDAISDLHKATQFRDDRANYWAGKINNASDDGLKDSWWDSFKDFIGKWAWLIKDICTVLEVIGAVLAILALLISGVGWLLLVAFIVTAAALLGRTLLALTGNGSWLDVAIDAFALLTLGLSGGLSGTGALVHGAEESVEAAPEAFDAVEDVAREGSELSQQAAFYSKEADELRTLADVLGGDTSDLTQLADQADGLAAEASAKAAAAYPTAATVLESVPETASTLSKLAAGSPELAEYLAKLNALKDALPAGEKVTQIAQGLKQVNAARGLIFSGIAVSAGAIPASGVPVYGPGAADFGGEDPAWQAWEDKPFDTLDEGMSAGIPDSFMNGVGNVVTSPLLPTFTYSPSVMP